MEDVCTIVYGSKRNTMLIRKNVFLEAKFEQNP